MTEAEADLAALADNADRIKAAEAELSLLRRRRRLLLLVLSDAGVPSKLIVETAGVNPAAVYAQLAKARAERAT